MWGSLLAVVTRHYFKLGGQGTSSFKDHCPQWFVACAVSCLDILPCAFHLLYWQITKRESINDRPCRQKVDL